MGAPNATILHADLDAFYASVEQLLNPALRGRPIAVGGGVGGGVVLAASYEAKAFGVSGGMSGRRARQLCPALEFVDGHFREYQRLGDQAIDVLRDFTPLVERVSIDEAFLDVTGSVHLFGTPREIAITIRRRVLDEIGLAISVGVATTKHLAKVASQVAKPNGLVVVDAGAEVAFLDPLPVSLLWGVGPVTRERLASHGIHTIGALANASPSAVAHLLGRAVGDKLGLLANNADRRRIETRRVARSVGAQSALGRRTADDRLLAETFGHLADRVATRLRAKQRAGRTITVRVRFADMQSVTRSTSPRAPIASTRALTDIAVGLARRAIADQPGPREVSLFAISVSNLVPECPLQLELPLGIESADGPSAGTRSTGTGERRSRRDLDRAVDAARARFGADAIGYVPVRLRDAHGVPDEFRELAEAEDFG